MKLNKILRRRRKELNLEIKDVAEFCKVSPSLISLIEEGERKTNVELLYNISEILGLLFLYLVNLLSEEGKDEKTKEEIDKKIKLREIYPFLFFLISPYPILLG